MQTLMSNVYSGICSWKSYPISINFVWLNVLTNYEKMPFPLKVCTKNKTKSCRGHCQDMKVQYGLI